MKAIIEIHYYDGGLKTKLIDFDSSLNGTNRRPDWLPSQDTVGLHNDIFLSKDEYVIELSRHKRQNKLITWIGVYSQGEDKIYADRGNYVGIGVWLINILPVSVTLIETLVFFCKHLVEDGLDEHIQDFCKTFLKDNDCLADWTVDMDTLPINENGIIFDNTSYPEMLYMRPEEIKDFNIAVRDIAELILTNCINANNSTKQTSRILYLLLSKPKSVTEKGVSIIPIEKVKGFGKSILESIPNYHRENLEKIKQLEQENKKLETKFTEKNAEIKRYTEMLEKADEKTKAVEKQRNELNEKLNIKSPSELLEELKNATKDLPVESNTKANYLQKIRMLENKIINDSEKYRSVSSDTINSNSRSYSNNYPRDNNTILDNKISSISMQMQRVMQEVRDVKEFFVKSDDSSGYNLFAKIHKYIPTVNLIFIVLIYFTLIITSINAPKFDNENFQKTLAQIIKEDVYPISNSVNEILKKLSIANNNPVQQPLTYLPTTSKPQGSGLKNHKIKNGQLLSVIARGCKATQEDIKSLNSPNIDWDHIKAGAEIFIPDNCQLN